MNARIPAFAAILFSSWVTLSAPSALAQGGGGQVPPGTIYFSWAGFTNTMNGAGGNKAALPAGVSGEPSRLLHGGQRWFIGFGAVAGTYPDGGQRKELFAVRGDGQIAVQLTDQADLEAFGKERWNLTDSKVSWSAARWVGGVLTAGGIYSGDILFDGAGDVIGLAQQPASPLVSAATLVVLDNQVGLEPDIQTHAWSPDGVKIVYAVNQGTTASLKLFIADTGLSGSPSQLLPTSEPAGDPDWSPSGAKIVFSRGVAPPWSFYTINPDGTAQTLIIKTHGGLLNIVSRPRWSPTSQHVIYQKYQTGVSFADTRQDVWRAKADGSGKTNLTADIDTRLPNAGLGFATVVGWR